MKIIRFTLFLLLMQHIMFIPIANAEETIIPTLTPAPIPIATHTTQQAPIITPDPNSVQLKDVYEALIKTKDDKITLASNFVNWIMGIAGLAVAIVSASFGWILTNLKKQKEKTDELIKKLDDREKQVAQTQKEIHDFLKSVEFNEKIDTMEKNISKMNSSVSRWEQEELLEEMIKIAEKITKIYEFMDKQKILDRIDNNVDLEKYEKLALISLEYHSDIDFTVPYTLDELKIHGQAAIDIYKKYVTNADHEKTRNILRYTKKNTEKDDVQNDNNQ